MKKYALLCLIFCFLASFMADIAGAEIVWEFNSESTGNGIVTPWYTDHLEVHQLSEKIALSEKTTISGMDVYSSITSGLGSLSIPGTLDGFDHELYDKSFLEEDILDLTDNEIHDSTLPIAEPASLLLLGIGMIALARFRSINNRLLFIRSLIPETHFYGTCEQFFSLMQRLWAEIKVPGIAR